MLNQHICRGFLVSLQSNIFGWDKDSTHDLLRDLGLWNPLEVASCHASIHRNWSSWTSATISSFLRRTFGCMLCLLCLLCRVVPNHGNAGNTWDQWGNRGKHRETWRRTPTIKLPPENFDGFIISVGFIIAFGVFHRPPWKELSCKLQTALAQA